MTSSPRSEGIVGSGSRLTERASDLLVRVAFAAETDGYPDLWVWVSIADMAHVRELIACGAMSSSDGRELLRGLLEIHEQRDVLDPSAGDIVNNRDKLLRSISGPAASHLHTGRARREATTVGWHLSSRKHLEYAAVGVADLIGAIGLMARQHIDTLMPDFTYLQHAQPTTLAHYLLTFAEPLRRDLDRLAAVTDRINCSPAGNGSTNGSRFPIDRLRLAMSMEFPAVLRHGRDAMWAPDLAIEAMGVVASAFTSLDRLAEELQLWSSAEFGTFVLADRHTRTSVIMPQKRNPYSLAMIRGRAREHVGSLVSTITTNLTPSGQPDNRVYSYGAVPRASRALGDSAALLADVVRTGSFDRQRLQASAADGFTMATDLCDYLTVEHGLPNRDAHSLLGGAVRSAESSERHRITVRDIEVSAGELGWTAPPMNEETLERLQDPRSVFGLRTGLGSLSDVEDMIEELDEAAAIPDGVTYGFEERFLAETRNLIGEAQ